MKHLYIIFVYLFINFKVHGQDEAQQAFTEGVKLLEAGSFVDAEIKFSFAISIAQTKNAFKMSYIYKGFALNGQHKYDSAIVNFSKAIQIDSLDAATYTDRGKTYGFMQDYDKAIHDFNKVLEFDSSDSQAEAAYYYLGRIHMLQWRHKEAIKYFDKLLSLVPTDAEAYFLRGTSKSNIFDIDGSITDFDQAIKYNPDYMEAYANRGVQKINKIPVSEKSAIRNICLEDPCADLLKAKDLGDRSVEDMLYLYCQKCK